MFRVQNMVLWFYKKLILTVGCLTDLAGVCVSPEAGEDTSPEPAHAAEHVTVADQ